MFSVSSVDLSGEGAFFPDLAEIGPCPSWPLAQCIRPTPSPVDHRLGDPRHPPSALAGGIGMGPWLVCSGMDGMGNCLVKIFTVDTKIYEFVLWIFL